MSEEKPLGTRELKVGLSTQWLVLILSAQRAMAALFCDAFRLRTNDVMRVFRWTHSGLILPRTNSRVGGRAHSLLLSRRCTPF